MIQLSHIGEELIAQMLSESIEAMKAVCGSFPAADNQNILVPEIRLNNCGPLGFDGVHKIDVAVLNGVSNKCYPIEAKLGFDRLSKNEFEKRFLKECGTSHSDSRVSGSMISILERKIPNACCTSELSVTHGGSEYGLTSVWSLICRKAVVEKWQQKGQPELSKNCRVVVFESLVEMYGSHNAFNSLVKQLVTVDYYRAWKCST